jgi:hypothetical protein
MDSKLFVILVIILIDIVKGIGRSNYGYVTMQFYPYRNSRRYPNPIALGGYVNSSPRRPRKEKLRNAFPKFEDDADYDDDFYDHDSSSSVRNDRCNCQTKYVAIEVPKKTTNKKIRSRNRIRNSQRLIASPVKTLSVTEEDNIDRNLGIYDRKS